MLRLPGKYYIISIKINATPIVDKIDYLPYFIDIQKENITTDTCNFK